MKPVISIGNQDFASIRTENRFYVDKTYFIRDWWESGDEMKHSASCRADIR